MKFKSFILLLLCCCKATAQPSIAPKNPGIPSVASIGNIWSPGTALYTGAANLYVPVYTIDYPDYKLPIGLSYSYNGLKYGDLASIVGLHWNLDIPLITRNVVDKDDFDEDKGYIMLDPATRNKDKTDMPDIFSLHTPEGDVRFILRDRDRRIRGSRYKAEILYETSPDFEISCAPETKIITINTGAGNIYEFGQFVYTHSEFETQPSSNVPSETYITTWFPTKIILENGREISFDYQVGSQKLYSENGNFGIVVYYNPLTGGAVQSGYTSKSKMHTDEVLLKNIIWDHGKISFSYSSRQDYGISNGLKLSQITLFNNFNETVKSVKLEQDYFLNTNGTQKRLRLKRILEFGKHQEGNPLIHDFEYNDQRLSNYYPTTNVFGFDSVAFTPAALEQIKYPTGLVTSLEYERNDYDNSISNNSTPNIKHLGFRISSIINKDQYGQVLSRKKYEYKEGNKSSGRIVARQWNLFYQQGLYLFYSNSNWTPPVYQTEIMGYGNVLVYDEASDGSLNGATRYKFVNNPSVSYYSWPGSQSDFDYTNGQVIEESVYEGKRKANLKPVLKIDYIYENFKINSYHFRMHYLIPGSSSPVQQSDNYIRAFKTRLYKTITEYYKYENDEQKVVNSLGTDLFFPTEDFNDYRDFLPLKVRKFKGNSLDQEIHYKYPYNFYRSRTTSGIPGLTSRAKTQVIEETVMNGESNVVASHLKDFGTFARLNQTFEKNYRVSKLYDLELNSALANMVPTELGSSGFSTLDPNYRLKYSGFKYDVYGNLTEMSDKGVPYTYIYGYHGKYLLAKIENADYTKVHNLLLQIGGVNIMQDLDDMSIYSYQINNLFTSLRDHIDMNNSLITNYTYEPLGDMISKTNSLGLTEYYEYDSFNRLSVVRDREGNIVKTYCYNYAGQQTDCTWPPFNVAIWSATGNTRCAKDEFDVNTGYQEREERDVNPESPSYNQIRWVNNGISTSCPVPPQSYTNVEMSDDFMKEGCTYTDGSVVTYTVPAGTYSGASQAEADYKAEFDLYENGQDYANANGTCPVPDAYISIENYVWTYQGTMGDLVLYFFDPDTNEPIHVNNMPVSYTQYASCTPSGNWSNPWSMTVSGSSFMLQSYVPLDRWQYIPNPDPWGGGGMVVEDCVYDYVLDPGPYYNAW